MPSTLAQSVHDRYPTRASPGPMTQAVAPKRRSQAAMRYAAPLVLQRAGFLCGSSSRAVATTTRGISHWVGLMRLRLAAGRAGLQRQPHVRRDSESCQAGLARP
jgi:hypothetical protein